MLLSQQLLTPGLEIVYQRLDGMVQLPPTDRLGIPQVIFPGQCEAVLLVAKLPPAFLRIPW